MIVQVIMLNLLNELQKRDKNASLAKIKCKLAKHF